MNRTDWHEIDETTAELEMRELLYALVAMLKPELIVETGCYKGYTTNSLSKACFWNKKGRVVSCDTNIRFVEEARSRQYYPVEIRNCSSLDLPELREADFIFSDSDYKHRSAEIELAKPGAIIVVHDTRISYDPSIPPLESLVNRLGGVCFETYRGFGILKKK